MKYIIVLIMLTMAGCASTRSGSIFGLNFSDMPPRAFIRGQCNGQTFTTQGLMVCEQNSKTTSDISVKIPPLQGRVVYSNGQFKKTDDFNWYPKEGFLFWKKKPIKDTWVPLDLGEVQSVFGDWPVALDISAVSKVGVINTRGIIYYRVCDDKTVLCSHLVVEYMCQGVEKKTGDNVIGKCDRMAGSPHDFTVSLSGPTYKATEGGRLYVSAPRSGFTKVIELTAKEVEDGKITFSLPAILSGPTLVGFRLAYYEGSTIKTVETRVLLVGTSPDWTGLDQPHYLTDYSVVDESGNSTSKIKFVQPIMGDQMEVDRYAADKSLKEKKFTTDNEINFDKPKDGQTVCAFAWQRDSSDLTAVCLNNKLEECKVP